jgi:hypothetical protein
MRKIGTFFYLLGIFWIGFFALSMLASAMQIRYLLYGVLCFVVGYLFKRLSPSRQGTAADRFHTVSRFVNKRKLSRQEKEKEGESQLPGNRH